MPLINNTSSDEMMDPPAGSKVMTEDSLKNFMTDAENVLTPAEKIVEKSAKQPNEEGLAVSGADKKEYIRTLLAGERFTKSYQIFGGAVAVIFKSRTVSENESIRAAVVDIPARNKLYLKDGVAELMYCDAARSESKDGTQLDFDSMDYTMYTAILKAFRQFETLCDTMFKKADDPNFWRGTDGLI